MNLSQLAVAPPEYVHETQIPRIHAFCIAFPIIALLFVGLRFYVRRYIVGGIGPDDWLALMGAVFITGLAGVATWGTNLGFGSHIWEIDMSRMQELRTMMSISPVVGQLGAMCVQLSLLTFYRRLSPSRAYNNLCYAMMALSATVSIFRITFTLIWCFHIHPGPGFCVDNRTAGTVHIGVGISINIIIFCMPIHLLWQLRKISVLKRIGLIAVFSVGLIAVGSCIVRAFVMKEAKKARDPTWTTPWMTMISLVEIAAGITCACLPIMRPLFLNLPWHGLWARGTPQMANKGMAERRADSGAGTMVAQRIRANWDGISLTSTWRGVQKYYQTGWGRKGGIIEVADLEGVGVLDPHRDHLHNHLPAASGATGPVLLPHFAVSPIPQALVPESNGGVGDPEPHKTKDKTHLQLPPTPRSHRPRLSRDMSRLSKLSPPSSPQKASFGSTVPSRELKASGSGDVLLSSMAPMACESDESTSTTINTETTTGNSYNGV